MNRGNAKCFCFAVMLVLGWTYIAGNAGIAQSASQPVSATSSKVRFEDITRAAGIHFKHNNGATGKKYLPETMGSGVAFIDYDNDGWQDLFFVNGTSFSPQAGHGTTPALYHNNHDGTFTDVTRKAGLAIDTFGMGVAVGDFDNDGFDDLFITSMGQSHLFHNNGNGTFTDVTKKAGLWGPIEFSTTAAWVDYDRDGHLDLVVANYVQWSQQADLYCTLDGKTKSYCTPESYHGASLRLWHNRGDGTFEDATQRAGLGDNSSKSLGIAVLDANQDGWPDLAISNDTQPNKLYLNNRNGTFTEKAVTAGIAYSEDGVVRAGMGIDAGDYDHSGYPSILISNFSNQMMALYHNEQNGLFVDVAAQSQMGPSSLLTLGFACFFFDYDLDGWPDVYVANGHIDPDIERIQKTVRYAEPAHLFHNLGNGEFRNVATEMGSSFANPRVARGAAYGDINNDGSLDLAVTTNGGPAILFRNTGSTNHGLRIKLVGTKSNRDGIGAVVYVQAGKLAQKSMMRSGSSYLSSSELLLTFGLGQSTKAKIVEVHWPSGAVDKLANVDGNQILTIRESSGIVARQPFRTH